MGDKFVAPPDFDGPTSNRHCTDVLCGLMMVAMWAAMTVIGWYSYVNGDFRVVLYPLDFDGNICGTDFANDMTEFPNLFYINNYGGGVCVKDCPSLTNQVADNVTDIRTLITYGGLYQTDGAEVPFDFVSIADYSNSSDAIFCTRDPCFPDGDPSQSWNSPGVSAGFGFAYYAVDTYPVLNRCIISVDATLRVRELVRASTTLNALEAGYSFWNDLYADVWETLPYILGCGFGLSLLISFIYVMILRIPLLLSFAVWSSIFLTIAIFVGGGYYTFTTATTWKNEDPQIRSDTTIQVTRIVSFVLFGIGAFVALMACCLRRAIQISIACIRQAGRAMHKMPAIVLVPVLQGIGYLLFLIPLLFYAVHLASLGEISTQDYAVGLDGLEIAVRTWNFDPFVERCAWFLVFCFLWTSNFFVAFGDMVTAMSFAKWYFRREEVFINSFTVLSSVFTTMFYHLGTCAYGSIVLAVVQLVRAMLAKIQKEAKKANSSMANALLCCCQCCLWCFEKCIKFMNKHAYVQTAIFGTSFCKSAREAFFLILRNAGRVGAITYVSGAILFLGKLFVSAATTLTSFYIMNEYIGVDVFSLAGPTVLIFMIAYVIADMFMDIFEVGITTILHCFVADEEMFANDGRCFADGKLRDFINKHGSED